MQRAIIALVALSVTVSAFAAAGYTPDKKASAAYANAAAAGANELANPDGQDPAVLAAGQALFQARCVTCHGAEAQGNGPAAIALDPRPADLTDASRWAATPLGTKQWIIKHGISGTGMAPTGLSDDEAWSVLTYIECTWHLEDTGAAGGTR